MTNILVADSNLFFRTGVRALLSGWREDLVIHEAATPMVLIAALWAEDVDIVLLDLSLGGPTGESLIRKVRAAAPHVRVIGLLSGDACLFCARVLKAGLKGLVSKNCSNDELLLAITRVSNGRVHIESQLAEQLALDLAKPVAKMPHERLTERELDIFTRLAKGNRIKKIAEDMFLSVKTVSAHKIKLLNKMGFSSVAELVRYAMRQGILGFQ